MYAVSHVNKWPGVWSSQATGGEAPEAQGSSFSLPVFCVFLSFKVKTK